MTNKKPAALTSVMERRRVFFLLVVASSALHMTSGQNMLNYDSFGTDDIYTSDDVTVYCEPQAADTAMIIGSGIRYDGSSIYDGQGIGPVDSDCWTLKHDLDFTVANSSGWNSFQIKPTAYKDIPLAMTGTCVLWMKYGGTYRFTPSISWALTSVALLRMMIWDVPTYTGGNVILQPNQENSITFYTSSICLNGVDGSTFDQAQNACSALGRKLLTEGTQPSHSSSMTRLPGKKTHVNNDIFRQTMVANKTWLGLGWKDKAAVPNRRSLLSPNWVTGDFSNLPQLTINGETRYFLPLNVDDNSVGLWAVTGGNDGPGLNANLPRLWMRDVARASVNAMNQAAAMNENFGSIDSTPYVVTDANGNECEIGTTWDPYYNVFGRGTITSRAMWQSFENLAYTGPAIASLQFNTDPGNPPNVIAAMYRFLSRWWQMNRHPGEVTIRIYDGAMGDFENTYEVFELRRWWSG
jgi:hypothetical protein